MYGCFFIGNTIKKGGGIIKRIADITFLILFSAVIAFFGISIFIFPTRSFSEKENRLLSEAPEPSLESIADGEYFTALGDFYSDQFPFRDVFTSAYAITELALGKCESNGIIYGKENTLIPRPDESNAEKVQENINAICALEGVALYIPPSSAQVFKNRLPIIYPTERESEVQRNREELYYRTDHHWTAKGAYAAYREICNDLGIEAYEEEYFTVQTVSNTFRGTSFSRSGLPAAMISPDSIVLYRYGGDGEYEIINHENGERQTGFYCLEALNTADKYRVFLGGNYSHLSISKGNDRPKLLLVKDSFANSVVPFLALHFDIEVIDPRYCTRSYLREQLARNDIEQILFLITQDTLAELSK